MRVLLVNPPASNFYGQLGQNLIPLGLGYLAAMLGENGHSVSVGDFQVEPEKENNIRFQDYDMVGISSDTPRFNHALDLGKKIRKLGIPVVFGGYHATFMDDEPILKGAGDFVVRGEGEYILSELIEKLDRGKDISGLKGLTYKNNGDVLKNPPAPLIDDLDGLPIPNREVFKTDLYLSMFDHRKMTTLLTSRGCPFDCYFCAASQFCGTRWRTRSLESIFQEMEELMADGFSSFLFVDDNFTLNYNRTMAFCDEVIARRWDIRWWCFSRVDTVVKHPDMVKRMAESGNRTAFLGLESGNQETLDYFQKRINLDQQRKAVNILKKTASGCMGVLSWANYTRPKK